MLGNKEDASQKRSGRGSARNEKPLDPRRYLDNHPARQANAKSGGLAAVSGGDHPANVKSGVNWQVALSEQIIVNSQTELDMSGNDWMSRLKAESVQFLQEKSDAPLTQRESMYKKGIEILIDKIFGLLQHFMYEFNKVAAGTDLHVSGTISGDVTEVTRYNKFREAEETKTYFRARFSTRLYSLVLRGKDESIDIFLLPVNRTMALSQTENDYSPLVTVQVKITEEGMMWRLAEGYPSVDSLEALCMWLFRELIQKTKCATVGDVDSRG
jgi:hypothetical protein